MNAFRPWPECAYPRLPGGGNPFGWEDMIHGPISAPGNPSVGRNRA